MAAIYKFGLADAAQFPKHSYNIVATPGGTTGRILIKQKDRFHIYWKGPYLRLAHTRWETNAWVDISSSDLSLDSSSLWLRGFAVKQGESTPVGEFYIYRLPDSGGKYGDTSCRFPTANPPAMCKRLRFEFYDFADSVSLSHRPNLDTDVESWSTKCKPASQQTGTGDGDQGPD